MSLYNAMFGVNPACLFILPLLGRKADDYPRFRDCFINKDDQIVVLTRVGGNNRDYGFGEEELYKDPNFIETYDDDFDNTYGYYVFKVPEEWKGDFALIRDGRFSETSDAYVTLVTDMYPNNKDKIMEILRGQEKE